MVSCTKNFVMLFMGNLMIWSKLVMVLPEENFYRQVQQEKLASLGQFIADIENEIKIPSIFRFSLPIHVRAKGWPKGFRLFNF